MRRLKNKKIDLRDPTHQSRFSRESLHRRRLIMFKDLNGSEREWPHLRSKRCESEFYCLQGDFCEHLLTPARLEAVAERTPRGLNDLRQERGGGARLLSPLALLVLTCSAELLAQPVWTPARVELASTS